MIKVGSMLRRVSSCNLAKRTAARGIASSIVMGLTDEQSQIAEMAKSFAETVFDPNAAQWDRDHHFPAAELRQAAKLGFAGIYTRHDFGGTGLSRLDASIIFEQLSMADPSTTAYISIHNMCVWMIDEFGSDELRQRFVPELCTMEKFASYCLTEPSSGSDAAGLKTVAKDMGDHYEVSGSKAFISGAGSSDVYVVMVRTGAEGAKGVSCMIIEKSMPGVTFGKNEEKMGWRSQPTRIVTFDRVKVPKANVVGALGSGFKIAMKGIDGGRVNIATCSLGSAQRCLDLAVKYTKERKQFGEPISAFQNTQFKLAECAAKVHSSRLMIREAARAIDAKHPDTTVLCAMAKMTATEDCYNVVDYALQAHGGYGYLNDFPIERHLRDLRVHRILEGTNEVMRMLVARSLLKSE